MKCFQVRSSLIFSSSTGFQVVCKMCIYIYIGCRKIHTRIQPSTLSMFNIHTFRNNKIYTFKSYPNKKKKMYLLIYFCSSQFDVLYRCKIYIFIYGVYNNVVVK